MNEDRDARGQYHLLFPAIRGDAIEFYGYLRMTVGTFDYILRKIQHLLTRRWCNLHNQPILPEQRLVITLRFLATGDSYGSLHQAFKIGVSTVSLVVLECMDVIWNVLESVHMPCPTREDFMRIAHGFYNKWGFPHCLGAIDGRHVRIKKPAGTGTAHYNYKKFYSMVLQAHVDDEGRYVTIDICKYGSQSDAGIFSYSKLKKALDQKLYKLPLGNQRLPSSSIVAPYFLIGDGAYPLLERLMKPFRGNSLKEEEKLFNKKLSRARVVVENTFARTCQKWRIFYTRIELIPENVEKIIKCTCILHNVILDLYLGERFHDDDDVVEVDDDIVEYDDELVARDDLKKGQEVRKKLVQFFMENRR